MSLNKKGFLSPSIDKTDWCAELNDMLDVTVKYRHWTHTLSYFNFAVTNTLRKNVTSSSLRTLLRPL